MVCDVVCGKDEGINGAWEGGGERIRKGGEVRDPNLQALSLENHQCKWNCVSVCVCACGHVRCNVHTLSIDSNIAPSHTHVCTHK